MEKFDVRESCEYQFRKKQIKLVLKYYVIVPLISIILGVGYFLFKSSNQSILKVLPTFMVLMLIIFGLPMLPFLIVYYIKLKYLENNYQNFKVYKTVLDKPFLSYDYRRALYYIVTLEIDGESKVVNTSPMFTSSPYLKLLPLEEFNNKEVYVWYDDQKDKVYIIEKF